MAFQANDVKCKNCKAPLPIKWGQDIATCPYCRSENLITISDDGTITLSLVQKVDSIDNKTDQILAMQKAASTGYLLESAAKEYHRFLQSEFKPRMVALEEERDRIGKFHGACGCFILAVGVPICLLIAMQGLAMAVAALAASGDRNASAGAGVTGLFILLLFLAAAVGIVYGVLSFANKKQVLIQAKMDDLTQRKSTYEKQSDELKKSISDGH